jgi:hypothetical protein
VTFWVVPPREIHPPVPLLDDPRPLGRLAGRLDRVDEVVSTLIRSALVPVPVSDAVAALSLPCTLTRVVTNWVLPGANEATHVRVFFWSPFL